MMKEIYSIKERQCYSEIYDIISFFDEDLKQKIPHKWISFLEEVKLDNFVTTINPYVPLEIQKIEKETKLMLSYLYIKYLSDENEKKYFKEKEILEKKEEIKKYEKFEDDIFKDRKGSFENTSNNEIMVIKKEGIWAKIKSCFLRIFKKK